MKVAGLLRRLNVEYVAEVSPPEYNSKRDEETLLLNPKAIRRYSKQLANVVANGLQGETISHSAWWRLQHYHQQSVSLAQTGKIRVFFIDGHADFYQPEASPTGEVADRDLAIVSGRGPDVLTNIDGLKPLVRDEESS